MTAAAIEVMQEMAVSEDMYIEQLNDTSFFATRSTYLYTGATEYRFGFRAEPNPDGGTIASLAISSSSQILLAQYPRKRVRNIEPYSVFWDRVAAKLGEGGGNYECPKSGNEDDANKYEAVCMFADRQQ